jgi:predicted RNase H-like HicB family nuclease
MAAGRTPLVVYAHWDDEAKVWVVRSDDVPGLATEAPSLDRLIPKLKAMIPELLDANGNADDDGGDIPFQVKAELEEIAHREAA